MINSPYLYEQFLSFLLADKAYYTELLRRSQEMRPNAFTIFVFNKPWFLLAILF